MSMADTIVALATPPGESAIGVVRLSGDSCRELPSKVFGVDSPTPRNAHLAIYRDINGAKLDQVVFLYYEKDSSYTGQPSLEIFCHGNPLILRKVMDDLVSRGCRLAQPGEFTRTAFISGKMELVQAESVATLIRARSERALEMASRHLSGETGRRINDFKDQTLKIMAQLEAHVDFPEEDLPEEQISNSIQKLETLSIHINKAAETDKYSHILDSGIRTLVIGEPNAGKSSLFNTLCGKIRTIVSDQPGTTRDYVSERLHIGTFEVELIDTAGLRKETTGIELAGVKRTLDLAKEADFFLLTIDAGEPSPTLPPDLLKYLEPQNSLVVENKIDLPDASPCIDFMPKIPHARVSALTGEGIDELTNLWKMRLEAAVPSPISDALVVNARHAERLSTARKALLKAIDCLRNDLGAELALSDIRIGVEALDDIVGGGDNEDMLDRLFESFCIGK
jgi:tRNA modification GTPase